MTEVPFTWKNLPFGWYRFEEREIVWDVSVGTAYASKNVSITAVFAVFKGGDMP